MPVPIDTEDPKFGVMVVSINGGSLAESIGIESESVIQNVAGQQITSVEALSESLRTNLGNTIDISWINKAGDTITHQVTLPATVEPGRGILGVTITPLSAEPNKYLTHTRTSLAITP